MTIYFKMLAVVLILVFLNFFGAVATTYYFSRTSLINMAETWLESRFHEALLIPSGQLKILHRYGLEEIPASITKAKLDTSIAISRLEVGKSGYFFAFDNLGKITLHPKPEMVGSDITQSDFYKNHRVGLGTLVYNENGEEYLAKFSLFSPWGWTVVATVPMHEVLQGIRTMKPYLLYLWLLGSLLTILTIVGFLRRLTSPLRKLSVGVDKIGKGDFSANINNHSNDELGKLTRTFNTMASHLAKSHQELEQRVSKRTEELFQTNLRLKQSVEEKNRAVEALRYNEQRLKAILEASPVGISLLINREINWANETFYNMLGYQESELLGKRTTIFYQNRKEYERVGRFLFEKITQPTIGHVETVLVKKDGSYIDCNIRAFPLNAEDTTLGVIIAITDITDSKNLEHKLQQARKMEAIGTLAGGVAHDLNNILSGIVSYPELLLLELPPNSPLEKPLLTIKKSGEKATTIVQDLLTMARRGVAVSEPIDVNQVIEEQLSGPEFLQLQSFHPNVILRTLMAENLTYIKGSTAHLAKSIMNLISNAAEAMPEGGEVLITTTLQIFETPWRGFETVDAGEYVVISIADKGIGISQEDMERVFEPFYTRKKMGRSGTGLGMAVVWGTVKDHDGYIDIQSIKDKGTTFRLFLPTTDETPITTDAVFTLNKYRGQRQKILVVDDSSIQREIVSRILTKLNYHNVTLESGEAAVEYLKLHDVELLILDMIMTPGIDGLETFRRIIKFKANQRTIVASGFSATDRVKEILKISGGKYLKKPYSLETLGLAVQKELSR